jgi:hypothetical protein
VHQITLRSPPSAATACVTSAKIVSRATTATCTQGASDPSRARSRRIMQDDRARLRDGTRRPGDPEGEVIDAPAVERRLDFEVRAEMRRQRRPQRRIAVALQPAPRAQVRHQGVRAAEGEPVDPLDPFGEQLRENRARRGADA